MAPSPITPSFFPEISVPAKFFFCFSFRCPVLFFGVVAAGIHVSYGAEVIIVFTAHVFLLYIKKSLPLHDMNDGKPENKKALHPEGF